MRVPEVPSGWTPPRPAAEPADPVPRGARSSAAPVPACAPARRWLAAAAAAVFDLVLPEDCAACGGGGGPLCRSCATALPTAGALARPGGSLPGLPPVVAAGAYDGALRAVLLAHKDGATGLVRPLGPVLAGAVLAGAGLTRAGLTGARLTGAGPGPALAEPASHARKPAGAAAGARGGVLLVPVPSSSRAVRERGHDHALRLAHSTAAQLRRRGVRARALAALRQARGVHDQGALTAEARAVNLSGAVSVRRGALRALTDARGAGVPVVLVDDVCASGATLAECARVLASSGHEPAWAAVAAATVLRSTRAGADLVPAGRWAGLACGPAVAGPGPGRGGPRAPPPLSRAPLPTGGPED